MPEQAPSTCALIQTETFNTGSQGSPSNTTILVLALSSPAQTRQPTNSTSSPARRHQTRHRLSPCPLSHCPPHFPPPIPWLASDGMPATASLTQPSAPIASDRIARQHSTAKALRMAKPLFLLTGWPREQRQRSGVYLSLHTCAPVHTSPRSYMCMPPNQTANSHSQRVGTCN